MKNLVTTKGLSRDRFQSGHNKHLTQETFSSQNISNLHFSLSRSRQ